MPKKIQLTIRLSEDLYEDVKWKCSEKYNISISVLIKVFLRSFVTQRGIGFFVGDQDLCHLFNRWLSRKDFEKMRGSSFAGIQPRLRDLYELTDTEKRLWINS